MNENARICVVIPTYNNVRTIADVIDRTKQITGDIIVVNDGCTDGTADILLNSGVIVVEHSGNMGKGNALKTGFLKARELGFTHAITIDSDGQHFPEDIPAFMSAIMETPESIVVGSRNLDAENMPRRNTLANRFSNFWFRFYTGLDLDDTQTGFRAYPLGKIVGLSVLTSRYEAELELLVFSAWNGIGIRTIPVRVLYLPEGERISHFRPFTDFARITILNTILFLLALIYGLPSRAMRYLFKK